MKAWIILEDCLNNTAEYPTEIGTWGGMDGVCLVRDGRTVTKNHAGQTGLDHPFMNVPLTDMVKFRLKDDDGEPCYSGVMTPELADSPDIPRPLDDFAMPNAGCTTLEILKNGVWEQV